MAEDTITVVITVADIITIMGTDTDMATTTIMATDIIMDVDIEPSPDVTGIIETETTTTDTEATGLLTIIGTIDPITTDQTTTEITDPTTIDQTITGVVDHIIDPIMVERPDQRSEPDDNKPFFFLAYFCARLVTCNYFQNFPYH